jgi:hypothetical protein
MKRPFQTGDSIALSVADHADARRDIEAAARLAAADPLDTLRALWRGLDPEQRAEFLEICHHQPEAAGKREASQ